MRSAGRPISSRRARRFQRRANHRLAHHLDRNPMDDGMLRILVHHAREQLLVEAAPVDADAHRLVVAQRALDQRGELLVALRALADVAGIDAVLGQRARAVGILRQQLVAVVVKVADQRHAAARRVQAPADFRHLRGGLRRVDGDAHQLRAGARERFDLARGGGRVLGVGVGHRLHHHRRAAANAYATDGDRPGDSSLHFVQGTVRRATSWRVCGARSIGLSS